jgi:hypothetical protein
MGNIQDNLGSLLNAECQLANPILFIKMGFVGLSWEAIG